ncbi:MrfF family protein [Proteus myxofaciens ATCC 19692]|uniref:MrfF family protein n=2 Tax=Proteus myxofaciens TaxID=184072 RepID=A0A198FLD6_9GAMM|nr:MrfF family protein [Proteus myxofaciens ATCC 19692]
MFMEQQFNTSKAVLIFILTTFTGVLSSTAVAKDTLITPGLVPVNITGNVVAPPPCVINKGQMVEVNFGDILSTKIDGVNYKKPINYNAECKNMPVNALKISVVGNGSGFDTNALTTNIAGLGVRLLYQSKALNLGQEINFTYPDFPVLEAIPVKDNSTTLTGGDFAATATLRMEYQ